jgi:Icc-related predicted phosphoesterase
LQVWTNWGKINNNSSVPLSIMKILALSDQVVERLYTLASSGYLRDVKMIIGCGDLPYSYLEYLVSVLNVHLYYVPGNHDPEYIALDKNTYAEGGINIDLKVVRIKGLMIAGLGGSIRYLPAGYNQYTQMEMYLRMVRLLPQLVWNQLQYGRMLDILVTHSPPFKINDDDSQAHKGLRALNHLIRWARPRYHMHGHIHFYHGNLTPSETMCGMTHVINVFPYRVIEVSDE